MIFLKKSFRFSFTICISWFQVFALASLLGHTALLYHVEYSFIPELDESSPRKVAVNLRSAPSKKSPPKNVRYKKSKELSNLASMLEENALVEPEIDQIQGEQGPQELPAPDFDQLMESMLTENETVEKNDQRKTEAKKLTQKISEKINSQSDSFQKCYEKRLLSGDVLEGHVDFLVVIQNSQVVDAAVDFKGRGHPKQVEKLKSCLIEVSKTVKFEQKIQRQTVKFGILLKS